MSSIVKKSTHFVPKVKKKIIKKKVVKPILTPPSTQVDSEKSTLFSQSIAEENEAVEPGTPPATQQSKPSFNFTLTPRSKEIDRSRKETNQEDVVDPMDTTMKVSEEASHNYNDQNSDKEAENSEDELFKLQEEVIRSRRKSSSHHQKRLPGITPSIIRNRSGSIAGDRNDQHVPVKIGIPPTKQIKRRRSLAQARASVRRSILRTESISTTKEPSPVPEDPKTENEGILTAISGDYVIGIDPISNRLKKYRVAPAEVSSEDGTLPSTRTRGQAQSHKQTYDADGVPFAPPGLISDIKTIKQLPKIIEDDDLELYAHIGFDVTEMTMADLCKPTLPIGKVSSNFELVKLAESKIKAKQKQRKSDRKAARDERISLEEVSARNGDTDNKDELKRKRDELLNGDDEPTTVSSNLQLVIGDGDTLSVDPDSLLVSRHSKFDLSNLEREESNPFENPITSSTYSKRRHTDRWTRKEVGQFYEALSTFGTDFSLISQIFPYRNRKQIKLKFNLEEKNSPQLIEMALRRKLPADFEKYCTESNREIASLEFYNGILNNLRVEHDRSMAEMASERDRAMKEDAEASRQREFEIRTGAKKMSRSEKIKELRKNEVVMGSVGEVKKQQSESVPP
jgi:transcription factor TFIIIB component B''